MECHDFKPIPPELLVHATTAERQAYEAALYRCVALQSPIDFLLAVNKSTVDYRHSRYVSTLIANLEPGEKLLITEPPRAGKSFIVSEGAPSWALATNPDNRVGHATYGHDFTINFGRTIRRYIQEGRAQHLTPRLDPGAKAVDSFFIHPSDGSGFYFGDGVGGGFTGRGFDWLFLDDLIKNDEEAQSQIIRDKVWQWIIRVALTRLEPGARVVGIGTPWHEDDWIGRAKETGEWKVVNLAALAEENDPLHREKDEPLNPERYTKEDFEKIRLRDPLTFAAMYQGHPTPEDGDVFKGSKLQYYEELPPQDRWGARFATVDLAHSKKQRADFSVLSVWMVTKPPRPRLYWIAMFRDKVSSGDHLDWIYGNLESIEPGLKPRWIAVGNKTFGSTLMDVAHKHPRPGQPPFKPVPEETDKRTHAQPAAALNTQGLIWLPKDGVWVGEAVGEMMMFDNGAHDDIVDTVSMAAGEYNSQPWASLKKREEPGLTPKDKADEQIKKMQRRSKRGIRRKSLMH